MVPNLGIFIFRKILQLGKFEGAHFKYDNSIFEILPQKYSNKAFLVKKHPNKAYLVPNLGIFVFREILQLDKFEGSAFKFQPENT